MSLTARELLDGATRALTRPPAPEEGTAFLARQTCALAQLCTVLGAEVDRAARNRAGENRALRALFGEAAEGGWAPQLLSRLREQARAEDADLSLSVLEAANAELRRTLILLHEAVETGRSAAGRARERRILRVLREAAAAAEIGCRETCAR